MHSNAGGPSPLPSPHRMGRGNRPPPLRTRTLFSEPRSNEHISSLCPLDDEGQGENSPTAILAPCAPEPESTLRPESGRGLPQSKRLAPMCEGLSPTRQRLGLRQSSAAFPSPLHRRVHGEFRLPSLDAHRGHESDWGRRFSNRRRLAQGGRRGGWKTAAPSYRFPTQRQVHGKGPRLSHVVSLVSRIPR
jgi:hypothetical protein